MSKHEPEIYVSLDVETDGPVPGLSSMLSLGAVAFGAGGDELSAWTANLRPLPEGRPDPDTMRWWEGQQEQWEICHRGQREPAEAILEFAAWLEGLAGRLVAVAKPAAFDHGFVVWYLWRFAGRNPLGHRCLDIRSCAAGLVRSPVYSLAQAELEEIAGPIDRRGVRAHVAVDDALEQGRLFVGLLYRARSERVARGRFRLVRSLLGHLALRSGSPPLEL